MDENTYTLFGLPIQCAPNLESAVAEFDEAFLVERRAGYSAALNAEKLFLSQKDSGVFELLNDAKFRYLDGIGAVWAAERKYRRPFVRLPGVELWLDIAKRAAQRGAKIAVIGGTEVVNQKAVDLLKINHSVEVAYSRDGYFTDDECCVIAEELKAKDIAFTVVAMGSPRQENFARTMMAMSVPSFFFGVGGSLDVFTGNVKRAPRIFRDNRAEWLYRLLKQPKRSGRQLRLVPYCIMVLRRKM